MKAARILKPKEPLAIEDLNIPKPRNVQVLVKVQSTGVCHSDLHLWDGGYAGPAGVFMKVEDRGVKFPLTPGHEVAGTVESLGEYAEGFNVGDKVLVYPWIGEGICPACRVGEENLCDKPRSIGIYQDGGYAEYVLVPHYKYLINIDGQDPASVASLACSGLTAYSAVKIANAKPAESLVIVGAGGLGLMGIQLAKALTNTTITVLDIDDKRLDETKKLGADHVINSKTLDPVKEIKELTNGMGADVIIDFVNASKTVTTDINMLRKRGRLVLVGLFGGSIELNLALMPLRAFKILGSYTGKYTDLVELVELAKKNVLRSIVSRKFKLDEANDALNQLKEGKIIGRAVISP
ncbi:MAG: zinc-binding alcohol dehydrogenase [Thaumarchaeota archaeon]|nr:zinc-binding alcohol dehydrogenase [Nitrososphaerota archaeon]